MNKKFQYDVFLSFASKDEEQVKLLYSELTSNGLRVFWSNQTLKESVGQSFFSVIQEALVASEHFLLVCTDYALESKFVKLEYETFFAEFHIHNKERRLVLYHENDFDRAKIPPFLKGLQTSIDIKDVIQLFGGEDIEKIKKENLLLKEEIGRLKQNINVLTCENNLLKEKIYFSDKSAVYYDEKKEITILVIDDEEYIHAILAEEFEYRGYKIISAYSDQQGIDIFQEKHPDLVILDINMPGKNGIEILRCLKDKRPIVPVILYSAYPEYKENVATWAADDYIVKSVDLKELFDSIKAHLKY